MKEVEFLKDYGGQKKGSVKEYDSMLASNLVNVQKVAKYYIKAKSNPKVK